MIQRRVLDVICHWLVSNGVPAVAREPIIVPDPAINVVPWSKGLLFQIVWAGQLVEWETLH